MGRVVLSFLKNSGQLGARESRMKGPQLSLRDEEPGADAGWEIPERRSDQAGEQIDY
jgi:hypothetical protein